MGNTLDLHALLEKIGWPKSYLGKVFLIYFIGTHIPLLVLIGYLVSGGTRAYSGLFVVFFLILGATLTATAFAFACLYSLLRPIARIADSLHDYAVQHMPEYDPVEHPVDIVSRIRLDITLALRTLEHRASIDPVTGAYNRQMAEDRLREDLARVGRDGSVLTLAMIDIDHFKHINDAHGHPVGDRCLRRFTESVKATIRQGDWLGRYGGDEFLLVLWNKDEGRDDGVLRRVREKVRADCAVIMGAADAIITVSIGAARISREMDYEEAITVVDRELLRAKQAGRDRIALFGAA